MANKTTRSSVGQSPVVGTVEWLVNLILLAIPIVGLIMCFVWAFGTGNLNRRNFARAALILMAVGILLSIIFGAVSATMYRSLMKPLLDSIRS